MKSIVLLLCLILYGCSSKWYGIGICKTDMIDATYIKITEYTTYGIGVVMIDSNMWHVVVGYDDTYIKSYDIDKIIQIRKEEGLILKSTKR